MADNRARIEAEVSDAVTPIIEGAGLVCEAVKVRIQGRRRLVQVVVDGDDGVDADLLTTVSQKLSARLDDKDPFGSASYTLEVSTPGVDRPLTTMRHWRRAKDRLVVAHLTDGTRTTGRVLEVTAGGVTLLTGGGHTRDLSWDLLQRGQVQIEFGRPEDHGEAVGGSR